MLLEVFLYIYVCGCVCVKEKWEVFLAENSTKQGQRKLVMNNVTAGVVKKQGF